MGTCHQNYKCRGCRSNDTCANERTMVDSSVILAIVKHEDLHVNCEDRLQEAMERGKCFITNIEIGKIYSHTWKFIKEQIEKEDKDSFRKDSLVKQHYDLIRRTFDVLEKILRGLTILEIDKDSIERINELFSLNNGLRMYNRDRLIVGVAESYRNTHFIFIDKGIKGDSETLKKKKFKITLDSIKV